MILVECLTSGTVMGSHSAWVCLTISCTEYRPLYSLCLSNSNCFLDSRTKTYNPNDDGTVDELVRRLKCLEDSSLQKAPKASEEGSVFPTLRLCK